MKRLASPSNNFVSLGTRKMTTDKEKRDIPSDEDFRKIVKESVVKKLKDLKKKKLEEGS
jgi:hypothetical protein